MPIGMALTWLSLLSIAAQRTHSSEPRPWLDPRAPPDVRAVMLLEWMTLAEKVAQTLHPWVGPRNVSAIQHEYPLGLWAWYLGMLALDDGGAAVSSVSVLAVYNRLQQWTVEGTRLGIPISFVSETLHNGCSGGTSSGP
jgi:hypothetical protein